MVTDVGDVKSDDLEELDFAVCALCDCGDCDLFVGFWGDPKFDLGEL